MIMDSISNSKNIFLTRRPLTFRRLAGFGMIMLACAGCAVRDVATDSAIKGDGLQVTPIENLSAEKSPKAGREYLLICKAKKSRFYFDWSASGAGSELIDQNSLRYKFRTATKPAGEKGENLKVGECGWAGRALANDKRETSFVMKSLSEEATQAFYKMRTGKVFQLPVRHGRAGMVVLPKSEVKVLR